jgi:hypothetical protein
LGPKTDTVLIVLLIIVEFEAAVIVVVPTTAVEYEFDVKTPVVVRSEVMGAGV